MFGQQNDHIVSLNRFFIEPVDQWHEDFSFARIDLGICIARVPAAGGIVKPLVIVAKGVPGDQAVPILSARWDDLLKEQAIQVLAFIGDALFGEVVA